MHKSLFILCLTLIGFSGCAFAPDAYNNNFMEPFEDRGLAAEDSPNLYIYRLHEGMKSSPEPVLVTSIDESKFRQLPIVSNFSNEANRKKYFYNGCYQFYLYPINGDATNREAKKLCYRSNEDKWYDYSAVYPN